MLPPNLTIALLLAVPVLMLALASFAWRKRSTSGGIELILLLCALALWGGLSGINRLSPDLESSIWILKFQFIGILGVGPALLATALASNGLRIHTQRLGIAALLVPMLAGLALTFTTERHGLVWSDVSVHDVGGLPRFAMTRGPGMWLMVAWSYLMIGSGAGMLLHKWSRNWAYYRGEALPTLIGIAVPIGFNIVYLAKAGSGPQLDFTPVAFSIPAMAFAWSLLFRDGIFDIVRFAQREILDAMTECGVVADLRGRLIYANEAARTRLGIEVALPAPLEAALAQHPRLIEILSRDAQAPAEIGDLELAVGDETPRTIYDLELTPLADPLGRLTSRALVLRDITERKLSEQRIRALVFYDSLTGLPNRRRFQRLLSHAINSAEYQPRKLALLFLDLDRFKEVNDRLGHAAGDQLLKGVAERLRGSVRVTDELAFSDDLAYSEDIQTVSRLAGDEFTILLTGLAAAADAGRVADRIIDTLAAPFQFGEEEVFIGVSIGIACYPGDGADQDSLMRFADRAMYVAKESGRNRYAFYDPAMNDVADRRHDLERQFRRSLSDGELELVYQPIRGVSSGAYCGAEATLRCGDALAELTGAELIEIAESCGLMQQVGSWMLARVCEDLRYWRSLDRVPPRISLNVSIRQLQRRGFASDFLDAIQRAGISPGDLEIEVAEKIILAPDSEIEEALRLLSHAGIDLAVDDFGTSHSSLRQLQHLGFGRIKLHGSLSAESVDSQEHAQLTAAIIAMARSLGASVAADSVETEAQASMLVSHGCEALQGCLISRELTTEELAEQLPRSKPDPAHEPDAADEPADHDFSR